MSEERQRLRHSQTAKGLIASRVANSLWPARPAGSQICSVFKKLFLFRRAEFFPWIFVKKVVKNHADSYGRRKRCIDLPLVLDNKVETDKDCQYR